MSISLPGMSLYYLVRDNLAPESFERILRPHDAWLRICREYEFDDRVNTGRYIVNMRPSDSRSLLYQTPTYGTREKERFKSMIFNGDVVMLNQSILPLSLFSIDPDGQLICHDYSAFNFDGAKKVIAQYVKSVSRRNYHSTNGKPRATEFYNRASRL